jgi:hypothetical protein
MSTVEERLAHMEKDFAELETEVRRLRSAEGWIDKITGAFKDDPDFEETDFQRETTGGKI